MFDTLSSKLETAFKKLTGRGVLNKADIEAATKEIRMALLEADVNFAVAKEFCQNIADKALGQDVLKSLSPGQHIIKIANDELTAIMGGTSSELNLKVAPPAIIMLVGLQGSGKTTSCGKLAKLLEKQFKRRPLLVPADIYRPAAIEQLKTLGKQINVPVFDSNSQMKPLDIATQALEFAKNHGNDVLLLDTAGRLQIDQALMQELVDIKTQLNPHEILLVADAMTGQEAVNVAKGFDDLLNISGIILTKLDGDARGGAALSMRKVTGKPIKFVGVGEKLDALEVFHPDRLASRILGMGDVLSLIEKATQEIKPEDTIALQKKFKKNEFSFEDFLSQMRMIKRMGSISSLAAMIPGMGKLIKDVDPELAEKEMKRVEAIILSMTPKERRHPEIIDGSRRKRISKGSGTKVEDINQLLKQFIEMKKMMQQLSKMGMGGMMNAAGMMGGAGKMFRGMR